MKSENCHPRLHCQHFLTIPTIFIELSIKTALKNNTVEITFKEIGNYSTAFSCQSLRQKCM